MKKLFIITLLLTAVFLNGCSAERKAEKTEANKVECFDLKFTDFIDAVESCLIDLTPMGDFENEDKTARIATFTSATDVFQTVGTGDALIHYQITYDDETEKVSYISFFIDKDTTNARARYLYHMCSIAKIIDESINTDDISDAISTGLHEEKIAVYTWEKFKLFASCSDKYLSVSFNAIEN